MLLLPLAISTPPRLGDEHMRVRHVTLALVATIGAANALALGLSCDYLVKGGRAGGAICSFPATSASREASS